MGLNDLLAPTNVLCEDFALNYLHFGSALDFLPSMFSQMKGRSTWNKDQAIRYLQSLKLKTKTREHSTDIIRSFGGVEQKQLAITAFVSAVDRSTKWKPFFQSLQCRGFSFRFSESTPNFVTRSHVNVHFALLTDASLYYPPQVRTDLTVFSPRHIQGCIGWLLGTEQKIAGAKWWFILNLQSDATSAPLSSLREIFKGWQRVMFLLVAVSAWQRGISHIAIPTTSAVMKAATDRYAMKNPEAGAAGFWNSLYEGTAEFFGLKPEKIPQSIDLQTMAWRQPVECKDFLLIKVAELMGRITNSNEDRFLNSDDSFNSARTRI